MQPRKSCSRGCLAPHSRCVTERWCAVISMRRTGGVMSPDISIVVCTWNRASLLGEALDTLLDQHDAPQHEVIVVDNASTDDTRDVVERRAVIDSRIRYAYENRQGLS